MSSKRPRTETTTTTVGRRSTIPVAPSVKRYVKGCMKRMIEKKYLTYSLLGATSAVAGQILPTGIFNITQGAGDSQREGNTIHINKLDYKFQFNATGPGAMRLILCWDRQANGANPTATDIVTTASFLSTFNTNNVVGYGGSRFTIVKDLYFVIDPAEVAAATFSRQASSKATLYGKNIKRPVHFQASAGAVADIASNNLFWLVLGSTTTVGYSYYNCVEFLDN